MSDEELVKRLRDDSGDWLTDLAADRIEAMTEQLEAARADAKQAEAYAEELAQEIEINEQEACSMEDDLMKAYKEIDALKAKLAKAVEALEDLADCVDDGCFCSEMQMATAMDIARTTLAEIKGESHD